MAKRHGRLLLAVALVGLVAVVCFTVPSTISLIDRVVPLSDANVVRVYLMWPLLLAGLLLAGLLVTTRRDQRRRAVLLGVLVGADAILLGVLLTDRLPITAEGNSAAWFTSVVLLGTAAAATVNFMLSKELERRRRFWRAVWGIGALCFAVAALDEALALHELVGSLADRVLNRAGGIDSPPGGGVQDYITIAYASGAVLVAALMVGVRRSGWIERGRVFHLVALLGIVSYTASVSLDNVDKRQSLSGSIDFVLLANAVEEVLEFTAASLFLAAALIAILEHRGAPQSSERDRRSLPIVGSRSARTALWAAVLGVALVALVVPVVAPPSNALIQETDSYEVVELRGVEGEPLNPDGIRYEEGRLFVTDDIEGSVLVRDEGEFRRIAGREDGFTAPESVAIDADGSIFISDDISNELRLIQDGQDSALVAGTSEGLLGPRGLAVGSDGELYISDYLGVAIVRYAGGKLETFAGALEGVRAPEALTVDDDGRIYVAEEDVGRVLRIGPSGEAEIFLDASSGIGSPEGIVVADDHLYVADGRRGSIFRFDLNGEGEEILTFAPRFRQLQGVAVGDSGEIYVAIRRPAPLAGRLLQITPRILQEK